MDKRMTAESVASTVEALEKISKQLMEAIGKPDVPGDQKFTGLIMGITISLAAGALKQIHESEATLRTACEAALTSLDGIPEAESVSAVLSAALEGRAVPA